MAKKRKLKKGVKNFIRLICTLIIIFIACDTIEYLVLKQTPKKPVENHQYTYYTAHDFGLVNKKSKYDYNENGIDDYTDILLGAKQVAQINPKYVNKYYGEGYPPENEGVCTDVIWWALRNAGYILKDMMARDIRDTKKEDVYGIDIIDDNIDFRRVGNQEIFFMRYAKELTTDIEKVAEFNPGDIVVFDDAEHIAMISDKRNAKGVPYLIQNSDEEQEEKEEDVLLITEMEVTGHYRFEYTEQIQELIDKM